MNGSDMVDMFRGCQSFLWLYSNWNTGNIESKYIYTDQASYGIIWRHSLIWRWYNIIYTHSNKLVKRLLPFDWKGYYRIINFDITIIVVTITWRNIPSPGHHFMNQGEMLHYKKCQNLRCQLCFALWSNRNAAHYHRGILWYHCHLIFILYQKDK